MINPFCLKNYKNILFTKQLQMYFLFVEMVTELSGFEGQVVTWSYLPLTVIKEVKKKRPFFHARLTQKQTG